MEYKNNATKLNYLIQNKKNFFIDLDELLNNDKESQMKCKNEVAKNLKKLNNEKSNSQRSFNRFHKDQRISRQNSINNLPSNDLYQSFLDNCVNKIKANLNPTISLSPMSPLNKKYNHRLYRELRNISFNLGKIKNENKIKRSEDKLRYMNKIYISSLSSNERRTNYNDYDNTSKINRKMNFQINPKNQNIIELTEHIPNSFRLKTCGNNIGKNSKIKNNYSRIFQNKIHNWGLQRNNQINNIINYTTTFQKDYQTYHNYRNININIIENEKKSNNDKKRINKRINKVFSEPKNKGKHVLNNKDLKTDISIIVAKNKLTKIKNGNTSCINLNCNKNKPKEKKKKNDNNSYIKEIEEKNKIINCKDTQIQNLLKQLEESKTKIISLEKEKEEICKKNNEEQESLKNKYDELLKNYNEMKEFKENNENCMEKLNKLETDFQELLNNYNSLKKENETKINKIKNELEESLKKNKKLNVNKNKFDKMKKELEQLNEIRDKYSKILREQKDYLIMENKYNELMDEVSELREIKKEYEEIKENKIFSTRKITKINNISFGDENSIFQ